MNEFESWMKNKIKYGLYALGTTILIYILYKAIKGKE